MGLGNCAWPEFCELIYDENDSLCTRCKLWSLKNERKQLINGSNYEWKCARCPYPIKPGDSYYLLPYKTIYKGEKVTAFKRIHIRCPEVKDGMER